MALVVKVKSSLENPPVSSFRIEGTKETEYKGRKYLWLEKKVLQHTNIDEHSVAIQAGPDDVVLIIINWHSKRYSDNLYIFGIVEEGAKDEIIVEWEAWGEKKREKYEVENVRILGYVIYGIGKWSGYRVIVEEKCPSNEACFFIKDNKEENVTVKVKEWYLAKGYTISVNRPVDNLLAAFYAGFIAPKVAELEQRKIAEAMEAEEEAEASAEPTAGGSVDLDLELGELEVELDLGTTAAGSGSAGAATEEPKREQREHLVKVYLLSMKLPSPDLVARFRWEGERQVRDYGEYEKERRALASRISGIRREAYERIGRKFVHIDELGIWLAVSEDAVKVAREVSDWVIKELKSMPLLRRYSRISDVDIEARYGVRAIPVYLEPRDAKEILAMAAMKLMKDIEELKEKIEEAEKARKRSALKKYEQRMEYKRALLEELKKFLDKISAQTTR